MDSAETVQGSPEWLQARCGWLGASSMADVLAKGQGTTRTKCLRRIVAERLTGKPMETYSNVHMERGQIQEAGGREAYEAFTGNLVERVGFIKHKTLRCGYSPDGHIGTEGGIEIKSVIPTVQIETILKGGYPSEHKPQIQSSLWMSERPWWEFCSWSPDMPEHLQLYVFRVFPDPAYILNLAAEVKVFLDELQTLYQKLMERK